MQSNGLFYIIAVPGRLMLPHWHCDQFMSLLGSISDRLEGQSPKFWGHATHRQTTGWWWSGTSSCEPISIWLSHRQPPSLLLTNKQTQTLVRRLRLSLFTSSPLLWVAILAYQASQASWLLPKTHIHNLDLYWGPKKITILAIRCCVGMK